MSERDHCSFDGNYVGNDPECFTEPFEVVPERPFPCGDGGFDVPSAPANKLYFGDNLTVLRDQIKDESVDLIYLDPPFNSEANYNVLFRTPTGQESGTVLIRRTVPI